MDLKLVAIVALKLLIFATVIQPVKINTILTIIHTQNIECGVNITSNCCVQVNVTDSQNSTTKRTPISSGTETTDGHTIIDTTTQYSKSLSTVTETTGEASTSASKTTEAVTETTPIHTTETELAVSTSASTRTEPPVTDTTEIHTTETEVAVSSSASTTSELVTETTPIHTTETEMAAFTSVSTEPVTETTPIHTTETAVSTSVSTTTEPVTETAPIHTTEPEKAVVPTDPAVPVVVDVSNIRYREKYSCILVRSNATMCSGVMISSRYALTVCNNCIRAKNTIYSPRDYQLQYRYYEPQMDAPVRIMTRFIRRMVCHPQAFGTNNQYSVNHDIGIVQVKGTIAVPKVNLVSLPSFEYYFWSHHRDAHLSNFKIGYTSENILAEFSWHIITEIVTPEFCRRLLGTSDMSNQNCIAYHHQTSDKKCAHDIGSGLVVFEGTSSVLIGLLVNKYECGAPHSVATTINIIKFIGWIKKQIILNEGGGTW